MQITEAYQKLRNELTHLYEPREASTIADMALESLTGLSKSERLLAQHKPLDEKDQEQFLRIKEELIHGRPLQYVLGHTWFCGLKIQVDERVLIPRPETEELVQKSIEIIEHEKKNEKSSFRILDIGTGSGCIAIALKKKFKGAEVVALDVSRSALELAQSNALNNNASIQFIERNILDDIQIKEIPCFDFVISNPPYIPPADQHTMEKNVLEFEPHTALFTSTNNPLEFYEAIVSFCNLHLLRGGHLAFETHFEFAESVADLLHNNEFEEIEIVQDMQGKNRMVFAKRSGSSL